MDLLGGCVNQNLQYDSIVLSYPNHYNGVISTMLQDMSVLFLFFVFGNDFCVT